MTPSLLVGMGERWGVMRAALSVEPIGYEERPFFASLERDGVAFGGALEQFVPLPAIGPLERWQLNLGAGYLRLETKGREDPPPFKPAYDHHAWRAFIGVGAQLPGGLQADLMARVSGEHYDHRNLIGLLSALDFDRRKDLVYETLLQLAQPLSRFVACRLAVAVAVALGQATASAGEQVEAGEVAVVQGNVEIGRGDPPSWRAAKPGDALQPGDQIRTGDDGRSELVLDGTTVRVRVYEASLLRLPALSVAPDASDASAAANAASATSRIEIERGRSLFDVLRAASERTLEVRTREVVVSVKGTRFSVDAVDNSVAVYRGAVGVRDRLAEAIDEIMVREGFALSRSETGVLELLASQRSDPWTGWEHGSSFPAHLDEGARLTPGAGETPQAAQAIRAARELAKPKAIEQAMERRPELKKRVARVVAMQEANRDGDAKSELDVEGVLDVPNPMVRMTLAQKYAQILANGEIPGGGGSGGGNLSITFVSGSGMSGGDMIQIDDVSSGYSASFDESFVGGVLDGSNSFPAALATTLNTQGVSETQFAQALQVIFDNN